MPHLSLVPLMRSRTDCPRRPMKALGSAAGLLAATVLVLTGCVPAQKRIGTDPLGRVQYEIRCDIPPRPLVECYRLAEQTCPSGYQRIETPEDRAHRETPDVWLDRFYVGKGPRRVMTIACAPRP